MILLLSFCLISFLCLSTYAQDPSAIPTLSPTADPTAAPTYIPTAIPTYTPSHRPTRIPTALPTYNPTSQPTSRPTSYPTAPDNNKNSLSPGAIAGIVIGTLALIIIIGLGIYYCDPKRARTGGTQGNPKASLLMQQKKGSPVIEADEEYHAM